MIESQEYKVALNFSDGKTRFIGAQQHEMLLDAALRQGLTLPVDCREGVCGTCKGLCETGVYQLEYADEDALNVNERRLGAVLACQMRVFSDCAVRFDFASTLCHSGEPDHFAAVIREVEIVSASTAIVHVDASAHRQQLDFLPGQYAHIRVPGTEEWRAYSFACMPNPENQLQFLIRLLPQGVMSNFLRNQAEAGQALEFKAPLGTFYLRQQNRPVLMIAGGTGLAPFLGILDKMLADPPSYPVRLFYGVTNPDDLCEIARLSHYAQQLPMFNFACIVMEDKGAWQGPIGVVTDLFQEDYFNGGEADVYLCGPPPMVEAVKTWLGRHNLADCKLYFEKFTSS